MLKVFENALTVIEMRTIIETVLVFCQKNATILSI